MFSQDLGMELRIRNWIQCKKCIIENEHHYLEAITELFNEN